MVADAQDGQHPLGMFSGGVGKDDLVLGMAGQDGVQVGIGLDVVAQGDVVDNSAGIRRGRCGG